MTAQAVRVHRDTYLDSLLIMSTTVTMDERPGISWAAAVMANPRGLDDLARAGFDDLDGLTANDLVLAAVGDDEETVEKIQLLLERGVNVNIPDSDGATPLLRCQSVEIAKLLIEQGANVNAADRRGMTPLHLAATDEGQIELGELLIAKGADVNARNNDGYTPLDLLITGSFDYDLALLLVAHGAWVNEVLALQNDLLDQFEEIRRMIASGLPPPNDVCSEQCAVNVSSEREQCAVGRFFSSPAL